MKTQVYTSGSTVGVSKLCMLISVMLLATFLVKAASAKTSKQEQGNISTSIHQLLDKGDIQLYYPQSVKRLYVSRNFEPVWITTQIDHKQTWEAMLMLDCVLEFGLSHDDYHPAELSYNQLHTIFERPDQVNIEQQAKFEILLSDALLTFMNHLHYGKLNPRYTASVIDKGNLLFDTENLLMLALKQHDFMSAIISVQPKSPTYAALQAYMHLAKGQYLGDCYEVPEAEVRKVAVNMERLRWMDVDDANLLWINIPAYTLKWQRSDTTFSFKVIVGKPSTSTSTLASQVTYFTTAPDWKVPQKIFVKELLPKAMSDSGYLDRNQYAVYDKKGNDVNINTATIKTIAKNPLAYYARQSAGCDNSLGLIVFRFDNPFDIYLHDTPQKQLFLKKERAFSHGCIRVEKASKLAELMLQADGAGSQVFVMKRALQNYQTRNFYLKHPIPIKVTYLTCESKDGQIITYRDIYNEDKAIEMALYNVNEFYSKR